MSNSENSETLPLQRCKQPQDLVLFTYRRGREQNMKSIIAGAKETLGSVFASIGLSGLGWLSRLPSNETLVGSSNLLSLSFFSPGVTYTCNASPKGQTENVEVYFTVDKFADKQAIAPETMSRFERAALALTTLKMCHLQSGFYKPESTAVALAGEDFSVIWDQLTTEEKAEFGKWYTKHHEIFALMPRFRATPHYFCVTKAMQDLTAFEIDFMMIYIKFSLQCPTEDLISNQHLDQIRERIVSLRQKAAKTEEASDESTEVVDINDKELVAVNAEFGTERSAFRLAWTSLEKSFDATTKNFIGDLFRRYDALQKAANPKVAAIIESQGKIATAERIAHYFVDREQD